MSVTLYWFPVSFDSWRVKIVLLEKNIPHETQYVDILKKDQTKPEYVKLNPRQQVPTLTHGNLALHESVGICQYLEKAFPEPTLMPTDLHDHGIALMRIHEFAQKLEPKHFFGELFWKGKNKEQVKDHISAMIAEVAFWDRYLEGREYLANTFSLADIVLWPTFKMLDLTFHWSFGNYHNVKAWYDRVSQRPSFQEAIKPMSEKPHPFIKPEYAGWMDN